ncbi:MAG: hypothetical protein ACK2UB_01885 [Anaerolineales bacterium]
MTREITRRKNNARTMGVLLAGGVIGGIAGVGAAYLLLAARERRRSETGEETPLVSTGNAVKLGALLYGLFRQIEEIARGE